MNYNFLLKLEDILAEIIGIVILSSIIFAINKYIFNNSYIGKIIIGIIIFFGLISIILTITVKESKNKKNTKNDKNTDSIFISYKYQDSEIARSLAEFLLSIGVNVWFAEYNVNVENYEYNFETDLNKGLNDCTKAIILTNDLYVSDKSKLCR